MSQRFIKNKVFRWHEVIYVVEAVQGDEIVIRPVEGAETLIASKRELVVALFNNELVFQTGNSPVQGQSPLQIVPSDYRPEQMDVAQHRLQVITPLLMLPRSERTVDMVTKYVNDIRQSNDGAKALSYAVSSASIHRWMKSYEQSGNDIRSLMPDTRKRGGKTHRHLNKEVDALLQEV